MEIDAAEFAECDRCRGLFSRGFLSKPCQLRDAAKPTKTRNSRVSCHDRAGRDIADDAAFSGDACAVADGDVITDAGLAADQNAATDGCRSCEADLRGDDAVFADVDVVSDMHVRIDLGSPTNARGRESAGVHGAERAYRNVVLDDDAAELGNRACTSLTR